MIFTGGDPLVLSARRLRDVVARLAAIPHVKVIRVHTRLPVVAPGTNHGRLWCGRCAREQGGVRGAPRQSSARVDRCGARRLCRLVDAGIPMLSQSVLLRGVNDDVETLGALMRALVESRIKPYYLHHADLAPGTAHLRTTIADGQALLRALHGRYSGLCQPAYVLDIPGGHGKSPVGPRYVNADASVIEDFEGRRHPYPPGR